MDREYLDFLKENHLDDNKGSRDAYAEQLSDEDATRLMRKHQLNRDYRLC